jgi:hypothetical protein
VHHSLSLTKYEFSVNGRRHQCCRAFSKQHEADCSQYWNAAALCFSDVNLIKAIWPGQIWPITRRTKPKRKFSKIKTKNPKKLKRPNVWKLANS